MEYQCEVAESNRLTPSVFELKFRTDHPLDFKAGQYVSIVVPSPNPGEKPLRRPYSIASAPGIHPIELCIQEIPHGPGSNFLAKLRPGDRFTAHAPYGYLLYHPKPDRDAIFIATGTGIAPFRSMVMSQEYMKSPPRRATCLLGVRTKPEILYQSDFHSLTMRWVPCLSKESVCEEPSCKGRVTQYLRDHADEIEWAKTEFYLCGNGAMIDEIRVLLKERGVLKESIHQEIYFKPPKVI